MNVRIRCYRNGLPTGTATMRTIWAHMNTGYYDCLLLLSPPAGGLRARHFFRTFHKLYPEASVILVGHSIPELTVPEESPDLTVLKPYTPVSLLKAVDCLARRLRRRSPLLVRAGTVTHNVRNAAFTSFQSYFKTNAAEAAILHTLMDLHPRFLPIRLLCRLAAKPGYKLKRDVLFPTVSRINKRAKDVIGRRLIAFSRKQNGYYIVCSKA